MKSRSQIGGILLFCLLSGFPGADLVWASACSRLDPFLAELDKGRVLEDLPDLRSCEHEPAADLAEAMASFIAAKKRRSTEIDDLVRIVRSAYRDSHQGISFSKLVIHLEEKLAERGIRFTRSKPGDDGFGLLDSLASQVGTDKSEAQSGGITPESTPILSRTRPEPFPLEESKVHEIFLSVLFVLTFVNSGTLAYLLFLKFRGAGSASLAPELLRSVGLRLSNLKSIQDHAGPLRADLERSKEEFINVAVRSASLEAHVSEIDQKLYIDRAHNHDHRKEISSLRQEMSHMAQMVKELSIPKHAPAAAPSVLPLEREVLREAWRRFKDSREGLAALESAKDGEWKATRVSLLFDLSQTLPEDLKPTFETILAPVRDFYNLVTKISLIPRIVNGELPDLPSEVKETLRLREFMSVLVMAQNSGIVADQLNFNLRGWLENEFLGFADRFLQRFQQARLEGESALFEHGYELILQVLRNADLAPIEIVLGRTLFDSRSHAEVSPAHFPNLPDGAIVAVVRNGFVRGSQGTVRQAEVIVNRMDEPGEES